jgi:hypothetical protein
MIESMLQEIRNKVEENENKIWVDGVNWYWETQRYIDGLTFMELITRNNGEIKVKWLEARIANPCHFSGVHLKDTVIRGLDFNRISFQDSSFINVEFINCEMAQFAYHESVTLENLTFTACSGSVVEVCNRQIGRHMLKYILLEHMICDNKTLSELLLEDNTSINNKGGMLISDKNDLNLDSIKKILLSHIGTYYTTHTAQVLIGKLLLNNQYLVQYLNKIDNGFEKSYIAERDKPWLKDTEGEDQCQK